MTDIPKHECRRCSDCEGREHHWQPDLRSPDDEDFEPGDYCCKHCPERGVMCEACMESGVVDIDGDECICAACEGVGVLKMTAEERERGMSERFTM